MRRPMWFNRDGEPITVEEWGELRESNSEYFRVAEDNLEAVSFDGEWYSMLWVSTVWLGINHNYGDGPPLIFETMVFVQEDMGGEIGCMCATQPTLRPWRVTRPRSPAYRPARGHSRGPRSGTGVDGGLPHHPALHRRILHGRRGHAQRPHAAVELVGNVLRPARR